MGGDQILFVHDSDVRINKWGHLWNSNHHSGPIRSNILDNKNEKKRAQRDPMGG